MRALSRLELHDLDERLIHQYHVPLSATIARIGKGVVSLVDERYPHSRRVVIVAGSGNTGAIGLDVARRLAISGIPVCVVLSRPELFLKPTTKSLFLELPNDTMIGVSEEASDDELRDLLYSTNLVIDCLLGYPLLDCPHGEAHRLITLMNESAAPTLSVDVPSGFDADRGPIHDSYVRADATLMPALPRSAALAEATGALFLADAGIPDIWFKQEEIERPQYDARGLFALR